MAPNPRRLAAKLDAIYERLPRIECKGLCHDACGPIVASAAEEDRLRRATGKPLDVVMTPRGPRCSHLDVAGRCSAYEARPLVCRLWGVTEGMPCTHGCLVEGERLLTDEEGFELLAEVRAISGEGDSARRLLQALRDPEVKAALLAIARRGQEISFGCPSCGKWIDGQYGVLMACPHCGAMFRPEYVAS